MAVVSLEEAARRLNCSLATVRRRLRNGDLKGCQKPIPQGFIWEIELPDDVTLNPSLKGDMDPATDTDDGLPPRANTEPSNVPDDSREVTTLWELVETLKLQVKLQGEELEARRREVQELHVLLQRAQAVLPAPRQDRLSWWRRILRLSSV